MKSTENQPQRGGLHRLPLKRIRTEVNSMARIVIVVEGGLVQEVFSTEKDTDVEVLDLDTEEGQAAKTEIKMPEHKVW